MTINEEFSLNHEVGLTLRQLRKERELTIEELAQKSEISGITISNIENGRSNPTLNSLWKLAEALDVPLTKLLGYAHSEKEISSLSGSTPYFMSDLESGWVVQPLFQEDNIEVFRVCLKANSTMKQDSQSKESTEVITSMNGKLTLKVADKLYHLEAFDSINFNSGSQHEYINTTDNDLFLNIVVKYRNI